MRRSIEAVQLAALVAPYALDAADANDFEALLSGPRSDTCYGSCTCSGVSGNLCMGGGSEQDGMRMASPPLAGASESTTPSGPPDGEDGWLNDLVQSGAASRYEFQPGGMSSVPNWSTNVSRVEFERNLLANGYARTVSSRGDAVVLQRGGYRYTISSNPAVRSGGRYTADVFSVDRGRTVAKIRLGAD